VVVVVVAVAGLRLDEMLGEIGHNSSTNRTSHCT
jgi:hypothetical protein